MKSIYNYAIVGAGQLGSRHLQSMKAVKLKSCIWVIDSNPESLRIAEERYGQIADNDLILNVTFTQSLEDLPDKIDFMIVATSAFKRAKLIKKICTITTIKNMLIEKVLFQHPTDYEEIKQLLFKQNIKAWVNCPRRMYPFYQICKQKLDTQKPIHITIDGSNWGMACNAIHFIDIVAFMIQSTSYTIKTDLLDSEIFDSKRIGYKEISGTLQLNFSNGSTLTLSCRKDISLPISIFICSNKTRILIDESKKMAIYSDFENNWTWETSNFELPFQSQLTSTVIESVMLDGTCPLTTFDESVSLHLPFIISLLNFFKRDSSDIEVLPIT